MNDFTFASPVEENHDISQFMEPHRGQNWNLVLSQCCEPEYMLFFVSFMLGYGHCSWKYDSV